MSDHEEGALLALETAMLAYLDGVYAHWRDEPGPFTEAELRGAFRAGLAQAVEVKTEYGAQITVDGVTSVLSRWSRLQAEYEVQGFPPEAAATVVERTSLKTEYRPVD